MEEKRYRSRRRINRRHSQSIVTATNRKDRGGKRGEMEETLAPTRTPLETTSSPQPTPEIKIDTIIAEIQTITKRGEEIVRGGKRLVEIEVDTLLRWQQNLDASKNAYKQTATTSTLSQILKNTEDIKKHVSASPKPAAPTWSQVAAIIPPVIAENRIPSQNTETKRKELKITVKDQKEKEELGKKDLRNIIAQIKTREPLEATKQIIAARRLPSGDILLSTLTEKARIDLEKSHEWIRAVTSSAEVRKTTFSVFIYRVRVKGLNTSDQKRII